MSFSFGYATLNRYDARDLALPDTTHYYQMSVDNYVVVPPPFRYRVLIPSIVSPVWRRIPRAIADHYRDVYLSMLIVNSFFLAATGVVIMGLTRVATGVDSPAMSVLSALLMLCSFRIVNSHAHAMVDSGELFFLSAMMLAALRGWWLLPPLLIGFGVAAKETVFPFGVCGLFLIAIYQGVTQKQWLWPMIGLAASTGIGAATFFGIQMYMGGPTSAAYAFSPDRLAALPGNLWACLFSTNMALTFSYLIPLGIWRLHRLNKGFLLCFAGMGVSALLLSAYAEIGRNVSRPLIDCVGPLLAVGTAVMMLGVKTQPRLWDERMAEAARYDPEDEEGADMPAAAPGS